MERWVNEVGRVNIVDWVNRMHLPYQVNGEEKVDMGLIEGWGGKVQPKGRQMD